VDSSHVTPNEEYVLAVCLVLSERETPDLVDVICAWRKRPEALWTVLAAMIKACESGDK